MKLEEIRVLIDEVDTQMKPLFMRRMECAQHVAQAKAKTGGDVFVAERERAILDRRAADVDCSVRREYETFLTLLMSVSRRYQYGILTGMQDAVLTAALQRAGLDEKSAHTQVEIRFFCDRNDSNLNMAVNMAALNKIPVNGMTLELAGKKQQVTMILAGNLRDSDMRRLLCQIGKETQEFEIVALL